jgi:hypothetical protein
MLLCSGVVNTTASYLGDHGLKFRPGDQLPEGFHDRPNLHQISLE